MSKSGPKPEADTAPAADSAADDPADSPVTESTKSAMAAALERKNKASQSHGNHLDGSAKVGGATENHKATRTFRRKSGG